MTCLTVAVAGGTLWLDRGSNPGSFVDRATVSYRATRTSHQQLFTLNIPRLHTSPGTLNSFKNFLWGNPRISYILSRRTYRHLSTVVFLCWESFVTGEQLWLDRGWNPGHFADRVNTLPLRYLSHPVISPETFHLNPTRLHMLTS